MSEAIDQSKIVVDIDNLQLEFLGQTENFKALKGISLKIKAGEIVGVVGESGSGKSVTAMNILRLLPRTKTRFPTGDVQVLDRDVMNMDEDQLREMRGAEVSMIFQEPMTALNPVLKVKDQMFDVILRHQDISTEQAEQLCIDLLAEMKIPDPRRVYESYPHELSGGMRQRVMIAMAFSCKPKLIIADEPTTALDVTVQAQILNLLKEEAEKTGTSVMMITHDLAVVAQLCDRVYVMYKGEIVEEGLTRDVIGNPQHAYTKALLNSLPEGKEPKSKLATVAAQMLDEQEAAVTADAAPTEPPPPAVAEGEALLEIKSGTVRYPKAFDILGRPTDYHIAVDAVDLKLMEGQTLAIVGESGSGKTSLASAIVGLNSFSSGEMIYKGKAKLEQPPEIQREIQMVFQDPQSSLDPRWPIWRIMTEPVTVGQNPGRAELRRIATRLCELVGLDTSQIDRLPHEFSGGQRQRIAIGRALSIKPRLLVLDEPTSALDVSVQAQILNLLLDLQRDYRLTYLFISHDVSVVRHISDHVAVMYNGQMVEQGPAIDVLSSPKDPYTKNLMDAVPSLTMAQNG